MKIRLENVTRRFGSVVALDRLSLEVPDGEMMVLLGPSGCGKSTALRLLAGLDEPSEGGIFIGDRRVNEVPPQERDVAMVFQNYALYPHMTVAGNIGYPMRVRKRPKEEIGQEVSRVASMLGIGELIGRYPKQLSGGQRQRVALARAIIRRPVAFLMDEPLSNLDAALRLQMRAELKHLQRELGTTTVYVTHDHAEAMTLAHRIAILRDGRLQQVGTPMELYRHPANRFVAGFLGTPPMNFIAGKIIDGGFSFEGGAVSLTPRQVAAAGQREVVLGFRPQDARLSDSGGGLQGRVYVTEEMGTETVTVVTVGELRFTLSLTGDRHPAADEAVTIEVLPSAAHLFDAQSGETLISGAGEAS